MRLFTLIAALPLAACSFGSDSADAKQGLPGSGSGTTRTFAATGFDQVDLRGSDDVDIRVGTGFSVRAEGPSEELDKLKIEKIGTTLKVGRINSSSFNWDGDHKGVKVFVTMPRIAGAGIAGSGDMAIDRIDGQSFAGETAGSGNMTIAALNVQTGKFSTAGSGDMSVAGTAKQLSMKIAGSGDIDAGGVKAQGASVSIAGSGNASADVTGPADVSIVGSGDADLGKGAKCTTSKIGSGDVHCG
ncbi:MAG: head GIN domain-containing protein [Pseudomonadota bacterium]|uniref:head GIN domain-containing protein n=1 Tax=Sphingomonas sp. ERG5 TaxID=1381597 RepID=UPI00054BF005|nr:head GIN domain-containing protein [Sphingomonas sp. ERG5]